MWFLLYLMAKLSDNHYSIHFIYLLLIFIQKKKGEEVFAFTRLSNHLYTIMFQFYKSFLRIFLPFLFFWWYFIALGNVLPSLRRSFPLGFNKPISCHLHSYPHASLAPWYWSYFWRGWNGYIKLKEIHLISDGTW